jgi:hypothetical protein
MRATYHRTGGVRYLLASYDVGADRLHGRVVEHKDGPTTLAALKRIRARYPDQVGIFAELSIPTLPSAAETERRRAYCVCCIPGHVRRRRM